MKTRRYLLLPLTLGLAIVGGHFLDAQQSASAGWRMSADAPENTAIRNLRWRGIGPANPGGRISVVAGLPGKPDTIYVAGAAGGIIKTTNGGTTWTPLFDDQPVASIGAIEIAASNENIVWVGTGEGDPRNSTSFGNGVYRSSDAGRTWSYLGLDDTERIKRIAVHPTNPDLAYVCALGHAWGPNEQRGVFRTNDGGKTWSKVLYKNTQTGCSDIAMDPSDPKTLYAGMYTHLRRPWRFDSGGGETALYKSTDGGDTWKKLTAGLPTEAMDRPGMAISPSNPSIVYLITETKTQGTFFRSDDKGESWKKVSDNTTISFRPFYYDDIRVDPANPDRIFALAGSLQLSNDGGKTWANAGNGTHGDHQAMWIDPKNPKRILEGSDGGFQISNDGALTWEVFNNFSFAQFYHVSFDMQRPYTLCGGLQDNGTWCGPSMTTASEGIRKRDWQTITGGDGFEGVQDAVEPWLVYSNSQGGQTYVTNLRNNTSRQNPPYPKDLSSTGSAVAGYKYRFNWNTPIVRSPHDPKKIYLGGNVLFSSINRGQSWTVQSPDLTTNDKSKQQSSGGEIVTDNTAAEFHCTILAIAESPITPGVIWVGTDDGNLQVTRDGGKTWKNVIKNVTGLPANSWIPNIDASPFAAGEAYVAFDRHRDNDFAPHAYKTTDYGETWTDISSNLPAKGYVHVVRSDIKQRGLLFLGTELGPYASWNDGKTWINMRNGLAAAPVVETIVHPRTGDLIIATHGRGLFIMDNIQPLRQLAAAMKTDAFMFDGPVATRWQMSGRDGSLGAKEYIGQNPAQGGMIDYYLKAAGAAKITIANAAGKVLRTINANGQAGVNRAMWDLRYDPPANSLPTFGGEDAPAAGRAGRAGGAGAAGAADAPAGARGGGGGGGGRGGGGGPYVLPGTYTVTLTAGGQTLKRSMAVQMDPRITVSALDLQAQLDASLKLRDMTEKIGAMILKADDAIRQLSEAAATNPAARTELARAKDFRFRMGRLPGEQGYRIQGRLREDIQGLAGSIGANPGPLTAGETVRMREIAANLAETLADWDRYLKSVAAIIK